MYLVNLKTAVTKALQETFDAQYPEKDFADVHVSMEYPMDKQDYPGIWVNYRETGPIQRAGIAHTEDVQDSEGIWHQVSRWVFEGTVSLTVAALSSMERDRLFDQVLRVLMASDVDETPAGRFKSLIEDNPDIGFVFNYDEVSTSGISQSPGTPWETNEILYEVTIDIDLTGEFISNPQTNRLVPLSQILVEGYDNGDNDDPFPIQIDSEAWTPSEWS